MGDCAACTQGYVCLGNTSTATPTVQSRDNGYVCPSGFYCPEGTLSPVPCPKGTYGERAGLVDSKECSPCPVGTYGDTIGLTSCKRCGGSSRAQPGAESCVCIGLNRVYLRDTMQCVCKPGYTPTDSSDGNADGTVDCQDIIYERCSGGQEQDQYGRCKEATSCEKECDGGKGKI